MGLTASHGTPGHSQVGAEGRLVADGRGRGGVRAAGRSPPGDGAGDRVRCPGSRRCSAGGWGQGVGEGCTVWTEGLEAATGGTSAMMTAATVRRARCWSASGLAPFALLRFTYRQWPSG